MTAKPRVIASSSPPMMSIFSGSPLRSRDGRLKWIITIAASANGTLIQNTSCQRLVSQTMKIP